jgi:tRNA G46 methylase TrmB
MQSVQPPKPTTARKRTLKRSYNLQRLYTTDKYSNEEILEESIPVLYEIFNKYAPLSKIAPPYRNFYDIGSGVGKVVIGIAKQYSFLKSVGIEIDSEKVVHANTALNRIKDDSLKRRIEMLCISMNDPTINYSNGCWFFISNLDFSYEDNSNLITKLGNESKIGSIIVSLKEISSDKFKQLNYISLPMSWSQDSKVYLYIRV